MIKCDFCVIPWYDENGKICFNRNSCDRNYCYEAIQTQVMKEDFKTRNSRNINNNYNYKGK